MTLFREPKNDELRFVVAAWASSYKNAHYAGLIASEDWPAIMHAQIKKLIERPGTRTIVAADPPSFLYGFICGDVSHEIPVVYYCYVKGPYRSQDEGDRRSGPRHARALFAALGIDPERPFYYTCRTAVCSHVGNKIPLAKFVPAAARYANYQDPDQQEKRNEQR